MRAKVEFPPEVAAIIQADWQRFIASGFREPDYTPALNFFLHAVGLFDDHHPEAMSLIWSFHFDESLKNTMLFWDDLFALKQPLVFREPGVDTLLKALQADLSAVLWALKAEAYQILEEETWTVARERWAEARDHLLAEQPALTLAQQHDRLPEFGQLLSKRSKVLGYLGMIW